MRYLVLCVFLSGCVTLTEEEKFEREYKENERVIKIAEAMKECKMTGGRVSITRNSGLQGEKRPLTRHDSWRCE